MLASSILLALPCLSRTTPCHLTSLIGVDFLPYIGMHCHLPVNQRQTAYIIPDTCHLASCWDKVRVINISITTASYAGFYRFLLLDLPAVLRVTWKVAQTWQSCVLHQLPRPKMKPNVRLKRSEELHSYVYCVLWWYGSRIVMHWCVARINPKARPPTSATVSSMEMNWVVKGT